MFHHYQTTVIVDHYIVHTGQCLPEEIQYLSNTQSLYTWWLNQREALRWERETNYTLIRETNVGELKVQILKIGTPQKKLL